ncbi:hypothetical protein K4K49_010908 [Colletotrichum sp. SAR 10_70]|nr:hypothetical protein K4K50_012260 [Colletotrichum sp. SAR 10_71]KAI8184310.1 hypothetical protein K4K51_012611 [Colletotrichum sp. SAR 10_75]KAI8202481.1 hypothetical protein K4K49_010908 [Colletotrichum sp. SAR 10_70]
MSTLKTAILSIVQDLEWLETLRTKGWTIVPETIPKDKALTYADKAYSWLEDWGYGFNRTDPATRGPAHLPFTHRAGIFNRFGVAHEQFMWDLKSEPSLIDKFARVWGTDELLVSYDGINLSLPVSERPKTDPIFAPWSHVDQSPLRTGLQCVQGILNLLPNGPDDGGLMVLEGSSKYYAELWQHFDHKKGENGWNTWEQQFLDEEMCSWLESKGCKWVKVCCEPGDLLLWDSRTVHYGAAPSSTNGRFAAYVCYKPASMVSDEAKQKRKEAWKNKDCTAHDPSIIRLTPRLPPDTHHSYQQAVERPLQEPVLTLRGKQLAGLAPY